jgi:hypothetical protein
MIIAAAVIGTVIIAGAITATVLELRYGVGPPYLHRGGRPPLTDQQIVARRYNR